MPCSTLVRSPTRRTHSSKVPFDRLGEEEMLIGASPTPNTESSTNCPGSWASDVLLGSRSVNTFSKSVSDSMAVISAGVGR